VRTALVPGPGYSEYARHFGDGGFDVCGYPTFTLNEQLEAVDSALSHNAARHLVIVNPNNPTATQIDVCTLKAWARRLECGGILIVDEAFADITPHASLLSAGDLPANVLVLRSFGKFFGLAGVRLGFAFAPQALRAELRRNLTLWGVSGPAQALGERALADGAWQRAQRRQLSADSEMTTALFAPLFSDWGAELCGSTHLFSSYLLSPCRARQAYSSLASLGVLCRVFQQGGRALLRLGVIDSSDDNVVAELRHRLLRLEPS
jgi:cobalamin biosynthetic protein CobC